MAGELEAQLTGVRVKDGRLHIVLVAGDHRRVAVALLARPWKRLAARVIAAGLPPADGRVIVVQVVEVRLNPSLRSGVRLLSVQVGLGETRVGLDREED